MRGAVKPMRTRAASRPLEQLDGILRVLRWLTHRDIRTLRVGRLEPMVVQEHGNDDVLLRSRLRHRECR